MSFNVGGIHVKVKKGITQQKVTDLITQFYTKKGAIIEKNNILEIEPLSITEKNNGSLGYTISPVTENWIAVYDSERYNANTLLAEYLHQQLKTPVLIYGLTGAVSYGFYHWFGNKKDKIKSTSEEEDDSNTYGDTIDYLETLAPPFLFLYFDELTNADINNEKFHCIGFKKVKADVYQTFSPEVQKNKSKVSGKKKNKKENSKLQTAIHIWNDLKNNTYTDKSLLNLEKSFVKRCIEAGFDVDKKTDYSGGSEEWAENLLDFAFELHKQKKNDTALEVIEKIAPLTKIPTNFWPYKWYYIYIEICMDLKRFEEVKKYAPYLIMRGYNYDLLKYYDVIGNVEKAHTIYYGYKALEDNPDYTPSLPSKYTPQQYINQLGDILNEWIDPMFDIQQLPWESLENIVNNLSANYLKNKSWIAKNKAAKAEMKRREKIIQEIILAADKKDIKQVELLATQVPFLDEPVIAEDSEAASSYKSNSLYKRIEETIDDDPAIAYSIIKIVLSLPYKIEETYYKYLVILRKLHKIEEALAFLPKALPMAPAYPAIYVIAAEIIADIDVPKAIEWIGLAKQHRYDAFEQLKQNHAFKKLYHLELFKQLFKEDDAPIHIIDVSNYGAKNVNDYSLQVESQETFLLEFFYSKPYLEIAKNIVKLFDHWVSVIEKVVEKDSICWGIIRSSGYLKRTGGLDIKQCRRKIDPEKDGKKDYVSLHIIGQEIIIPNVYSPTYLFSIEGKNSSSRYYDQEETEKIQMRFPISFIDKIGGPDKFVELCKIFSDYIPYNSGNCSWNITDSKSDPTIFKKVGLLAQQYPELDISFHTGIGIGKENYLTTKCKGAQWLSFLSFNLVEQLNSIDNIKKQIDKKINIIKTQQGYMFRCGYLPSRKGENRLLLRSLARAIEPITMFDWQYEFAQKQHVGNLEYEYYYPGGSDAWEHRFIDDDETIQQRVAQEKLLQQITKAANKNDLSQVQQLIVQLQLFNKQIIENLYTLGSSMLDKFPEIAYELLKKCTQYPDCGEQVYNNYLYLLIKLHKIEEGWNFLPQALPFAHKNILIYHNAACIAAHKDISQALKLVKLAKENNYHDFDRMQYDEDLAPLHHLPEFKKLFSSQKK